MPSLTLCLPSVSSTSNPFCLNTREVSTLTSQHYTSSSKALLSYTHTQNRNQTSVHFAHPRASHVFDISKTKKKKKGKLKMIITLKVLTVDLSVIRRGNRSSGALGEKERKKERKKERGGASAKVLSMSERVTDSSREKGAEVIV